MAIPFKHVVSLGETSIGLADEALAAGSRFSDELLTLIPWQRSAVANVAGKELPGALDTGMHQLNGIGSKTGGLSQFERVGYAEVTSPGIRVPSNMPVMRTSETLTEPEFIVSGGRISEIVLPKSVSPAFKTDTLVATGYADMIHYHPSAFNAVSKIERNAIGFGSRKVTVDASPDQMQQTAIDGAMSFVKGTPGNKYTAFLTDEFGNYEPLGKWVRTLKNVGLG